MKWIKKYWWLLAGAALVYWQIKREAKTQSQSALDALNAAAKKAAPWLYE